MWENIIDTPPWSRLSVPGGWLILVNGVLLQTIVVDAGHTWQVSPPVPVPTPDPLPTLILTVSPTSIVAGGTATLTWSSTGATAVSFTAGLSGNRPLSGSEAISTTSLVGTTQFTMIATGPGGTVTKTVSLTVTAAPPVPVPTSKWVGTNLAEMSDWQTDFPFLNFMTRKRAWISGDASAWDNGQALNLDLQGNVLSLASGQIARGVLFTGKRPTENFIVTYEGTGTLTFDSTAIVSSAPGRIVIRPSATGNVTLNIVATTAGNPVRNIKIILERHASATGLFNPEFLADMKKYAAIRFMDWQKTNFQRSATALQKDFVSLTALPISFAGDNVSVPVEVMIELANQAGIDPWFCIHSSANSVYIDQFLNLVKTKLATGLKAHIELSNEVWNSMFPQHAEMPGADYTAKMTTFALRSADLAARTKAILGARGVSIHGAQSAGTWWINNSLTIMKNAGKVLPEVVATAPYFGHSLPDDLNTFTDGRMTTAVQTAINEVKGGKSVCDTHGVRLAFYEGGSHILGPTGGASVNRDPRMQAVYEDYLRAIRTVVPTGPFCHFTYVSPYNQYGSWGEREYQYASDSPKSLAIKTIINS